MTVMRGLARLFTRTVEAAREPELRDEEMKQRRPALRCLGCNSWNRAGLVFMSNGGDYCTSCAKAVEKRYGYKVIGKRSEDITSL